MCGLFGVVNYGGHSVEAVENMVYLLGTSSEIRGTDASGISYYNTTKEHLSIVRAPIKFSNMDVRKYNFGLSPVIMGHTRFTTQGLASKNENNHPFPSKFGKFTMAHNGVLSNDDILKFEHKLDYTVDTDSYVVVSMLDTLHNGVVNFDTLKDVVEKVGGTFNFTFLDNKNNLWIVRHNNPLYILNIADLSMIAYASTPEIMIDALDAYFGGDVTSYLMTRAGDVAFAEEILTKSGEIIKIEPTGRITKGKFKPKPVSYSVSRVYDDYEYYYPTGKANSRFNEEGWYWEDEGYNDIDSYNKYMAFKNNESTKGGCVIEEKEEGLRLFDLPSVTSYVVVSYENSQKEVEDVVVTASYYQKLMSGAKVNIYSDFIGAVEKIGLNDVVDSKLVSVSGVKALKNTKTPLLSSNEYSLIKPSREWLPSYAQGCVKNLTDGFKNYVKEDRKLLNTLLNKYLVGAYLEREINPLARSTAEINLFKTVSCMDATSSSDEVAIYLYYLNTDYIFNDEDVPF